MSQQSVRVAARRTVLDARVRMRAQLSEQERRRSALAVTVVQALAERDAAVVVCERRAGDALVALTGVEGLGVAEVAAWCGDLSFREVTRLRRTALAGDLAGSAAPAVDAAASRDSDVASVTGVAATGAQGVTGERGVPSRGGGVCRPAI